MEAGTGKLKSGRHGPACCTECLYARPEPSSISVCLVIARSSRAALRGNHPAPLKTGPPTMFHAPSLPSFRGSRGKRREPRFAASLAAYATIHDAAVDEYAIGMDGVWLPRPSIPHPSSLQVPAVHSESHNRPQNRMAHLSHLDWLSGCVTSRGSSLATLKTGNISSSQGLAPSL